MTDFDPGFRHQPSDDPRGDVVAEAVGVRMPEPFASRASHSTGPVIASLALLYLRHNDPARALALGIAAMKMGAVTPPVALLVATAFLRAGDPEQAAAALSRIDRSESGARPGDLSRPPDDRERAAAALLRAKIRFRLGDVDGARAALEAARPPALREDSA